MYVTLYRIQPSASLPSYQKKKKKSDEERRRDAEVQIKGTERHWMTSVWIGAISLDSCRWVSYAI